MIKRGVGKKGLSPVIATVLLIGVTVMMGVIIFLWFNNMRQETITKFDGTNVESICEEVRFEASYSGGNLYISNKGNVPIYNMNLKKSGEGSYETDDLENIPSSNWPPQGLNQGSAFSGTINVDGANKIKLIPILLGSSAKGEKSYVCDERLGYEIDV